MNAFQAWDKSESPVYDQPQLLQDGSHYMATRYRGQFSSKMPLVKYPFDSQKLFIDIEDNGLGAGSQIYVPDNVPVAINPKIQLSGYVIGSPTLTIAANPYPTNFGDTNIKALEPYSRATLTIPIARPTVTFGIKVILPILLVAACAALVFWLHPSLVDGRIGLGITALLTLVALQLTTNDKLPDVDYLLMIDGLFFLAYIFVIACLGQVVRSSWLTHAGNDTAAIAQDRMTFLVLGGLFVIGVGAVICTTLAS
jgi:Neurotransmitter-gated ion-channel transmembrane region